MRIPRTAAALLGIALGWAIAEAADPPPVLKDLGQVRPTPQPTEKAYQKKRLITSITVQNSPEGQTVITFEASDVAKQKDGTFKTLAAERYSFGEVKKEHAAERDEAMREVRRLEEALLHYVAARGGPRERITDKSGEKPPE
jgi:hypothetical protein